MAELEGDLDKAGKLREQLDALEERANELDKLRSQNISSVR